MKKVLILTFILPAMIIAVAGCDSSDEKNGGDEVSLIGTQWKLDEAHSDATKAAFMDSVSDELSHQLTR